jgi:hypothetical protein
MQELFKKYGKGGFITYSTISFISFSSWTAIMTLGVDMQPVMDHLSAIKKRLGFEETQTSQNDLEGWGKIGTSLAMAIAAHKLIFPIRLGLTAMLTPAFTRILQRRGFLSQAL